MKGPKHSGTHLKAGEFSRKHGGRVPRQKHGDHQKRTKMMLKRINRRGI